MLTSTPATGTSREAFASAPGFPRAVIDGFLSAADFRAVASEFPPPDSLSGRPTKAYAKAAGGDLATLGPATRAVISRLQAQPWLDHLAEVTGIPDLVADPLFAPHLVHATPTGGFTRVHRDSMRHPSCALFRRVALILYVHDEWDPAWGGDFEVWDRRMRTRIERVAPLPNRAVLFATTPASWHGFPDPLRCPPRVSRRALTLWYWTEAQPPGRTWRRGDAAATFRPRPRSGDPTRWSMRQRPIRRILVPFTVRRHLRRMLGRSV
ncbi:MAG TPA: 2OG-Fe(II) oxygenase [Acidimicrobiia bacterium]|nr:2OG-Fe(II) oxygenase [Acidimicrobiia bacterium]